MKRAVICAIGLAIWPTIAIAASVPPLVALVIPLMGSRFAAVGFAPRPSAAITTGQIYTMPGDSTTMFLSFWYDSAEDQMPSPGTQHLYFSAHDYNAADFVSVYAVSSGDSMNLAFDIGEFGASANGHLYLAGPAIPYNGHWHNIQLYVDTQNAIYEYALDGNVGNLSVVSASAAYPVMLWANYSSYFIGGEANASAPYSGQMAEFYLNVGQQVNLPGSVGSFYQNGHAVGLGAQCQYPLGTTPQICNRGTFTYFYTSPTMSYNFVTYPGHFPLVPSLGDPCNRNFPGYQPNLSGVYCQ
jgi:hypothetical protein